ncbi:hypothetical protein TWF225_010248 [Orbilia oligospora]|nr:hypothetical protein TWF225_010248 [Orbilia oligospora]KAF3249701.1 hypothetical protein TWF128_007713 [Orbilia oligospora]KAF3261523.1 hypothetical protein TWF217_004650 [Orbilia oligospora]KAF3298544.1 hypothetical protein TWF132_000349 [Orbilia oligospora]
MASSFSLKHADTAPAPIDSSLGKDIMSGPEGTGPDGAINSGQSTPTGRPYVARHMSSPATLFRSPTRHHRRTHSTPRREVKETLDASMQYNENDDRRINQYIIKQEIGRGSFGSVHLATDQDGIDYAMKEFSKSRLRKQIKSNLMRHGPHTIAPRGGRLNVPMHRRKGSDLATEGEAANPLFLIRGEIAAMKKLNHENLVNLIEVLDDPDGDSIYMVLEMCAKGVIMRVGIGENATPFAENDCRYWFRDLMLGIEYLHAQGIIHRDIKPDNLLLNHNNCLKIVDFGVSEIFNKDAAMKTSKSAGSPAFLPPEMCTLGQTEYDGRAADIWSMGVCLYCFFYGRLPFDHDSIMELYESIREEEIQYTDDTPPELLDLFHKILERDPTKRITMDELRVHPWITNNGKDTLLSKEENVSDIVEPPTDDEIRNAITKSIRNVVAAVKAVSMFKRLVIRRRHERMLAEAARENRYTDSTEALSSSPTALTPPLLPWSHRPRSTEVDNRTNVQGKLAGLGIQTDPQAFDLRSMAQALPKREDSGISVNSATSLPGPAFQFSESASTPIADKEAMGIWHELLRNAVMPQRKDSYEDKTQRPYLNVGNSDSPAGNFITRSPAPTDLPIYETAYQDDVQRIQREQGTSATVYSNRRVDEAKEGSSKWGKLRSTTT